MNYCRGKRVCVLQRSGMALGPTQHPTWVLAPRLRISGVILVCPNIPSTGNKWTRRSGYYRTGGAINRYTVIEPAEWVCKFYEQVPPSTARAISNNFAVKD